MIFPQQLKLKWLQRSILQTEQGVVYHNLVELSTEHGTARFWIIGTRADYIRRSTQLEIRYVLFQLFNQGYAAANRSLKQYAREVWGLHSEADYPPELERTYREDKYVHQKLRQLGIVYSEKLIEMAIKQHGSRFLTLETKTKKKPIKASRF